MGQTLAVIIPIILAALTLLYLALFGQRSIAEYRHRRSLETRKAHNSTTRTGPAENLPTADFTIFLGRFAEQQAIHNLLLPYPRSQHSVISIDGIGGSGKSALALKVARRYVDDFATLPPDERFDAVIWTSAKEEFLTATGTQARPWRHKTLDDIFETIATCLDRQDITRAESGQQINLVQAALKRQRTLLVIDNLETVDDDTIYAFIRELPAPTKAIVTTRSRIDVAVSIHLAGMSTDEALELLSTQLSSNDVIITSPSRDKVVEQSGGLPLAIVWCAARLRLGDSVDDVLHDVQRSEGMLSSYTLGAIWKKLSANNDEVLEVLCTLSVLPAPATIELISGTSRTAAGINDVRRIVNSLVNMCLVTRRGDVWELHPLVRAYVHESELTDRTVYLDRAASAIKVRLHDLIGDERESSVSVVQYAALDADRANILFVLDWCASEKRWNDAKDIVRGLGYYLHARGLWSDAVRAWEIGTIGAEECGDVVLQSRFIAYLGYMAFFMGNARRAEFHRDQALRLIDRNSASYQRGSLFRLTGYLTRASGKINMALADFENGLADMRACENRHGICRLLNDIAETRTIMRQTMGAEAAAQEALSLAEAAGELIERVRAIYVLASLARIAGNYKRALNYAIESRDQALQCGWWEDAAKASLEIARCSASMRDRKGCGRSAAEAFDYFDRIGSELGRNEAEAVLADCGAPIKKLTDAPRTGQ